MGEYFQLLEIHIILVNVHYINFILLIGIYNIITQILFLMFMVEHYLQHIQIHQIAQQI